MAARVLVVEDESSLADNLLINLEAEGYTVSVAPDCAEARRLLTDRGGWDLILLDVMLPDGTGLEIARDLRSTGFRSPIIMLTARTGVDAVVEGLEAGADDYLGKPFDLDELLGRIRAMLRRRSWERSDRLPAATATTSMIGTTEVDLRTGVAQRADGERRSLTAVEVRLLKYLLAHVGETCSRETLLRAVWEIPDPSSVRTRTVDNFMARLRRHIELDPKNPLHLFTEHGAGYRLEV